MSDLPKPPRRACRFVLDLQADDRRALASALYQMADQIERGQMGRSISGGYSAGYICELIENDHPTHDEWYEELTAYLAALGRSALSPSEKRGPL
jgi:hypothetical protein